ncbi:hypothetical protein [Roseibium sp.]|uniref:hypothetical protein n=1 Tax=Roseibium sp. TaxID=1936156 RepID=UPI003B509D99
MRKQPDLQACAGQEEQTLGKRDATAAHAVATDMDWRLETKIHQVRVDNQRFELLDRLVFGE